MADKLSYHEKLKIKTKTPDLLENVKSKISIKPKIYRRSGCPKEKSALPKKEERNM